MPRSSPHRPTPSGSGPAGVLVLAAALLLGAAAAGPARAARLALTPVQDRAGDPALAAAVEAEVRSALGAVHELTDPDLLRDALRRERIRNIDHATAEDLRSLADETGADRVVSITLHQALRAEPPRVALSGRLWNAARGEMDWAGFRARSGLDSRTVLGLGVIVDPERLAARTAEDLTAELLAALGGSTRAAATMSGRVALVPLGGVTDRAATNAAETGTEVVRAVLHRHGVELAPSGCVIGVLRRQTFYAWGGVTSPARGALVTTCGARWILTGQVEAFDLSSRELEPDPRVAIALRLLDAETGEIVWTGGLDREGHDSEIAFRLGRIRTRGQLAERLVETLIRRLLEEAAAGTPTERT